MALSLLTAPVVSASETEIEAPSRGAACCPLTDEGRLEMPQGLVQIPAPRPAHGPPAIAQSMHPCPHGW
eukprot:986664-Prymnesium_polylepis.1